MPRRGAREPGTRRPSGWLDLGPGWLFSSIRDAVLVLDAESGQIAIANPAAAELFAAPRSDQLVGQSIDRFVPDLRVMPAWDALRAGPSPAATLALYAERLDQLEVSIELTLGRVEPLTDGPLYLVAIIRDITERRLAEEERIERIREQAAEAESIAARRRLAVLAEASKLLDASLDYEATIQQVARVAASTLADWCIVHLLEPDGTIRWLAVAYGDPAKEAVARELQRRYPASLDSRQGVGRVLSTGEPVVYAHIPESRLARARDPEHLRLLRALGSRSAMILPLAVRGRMLGALSLISSRADREYSGADLVIGEELARRCAHAVDNARLHQEAQAALRTREHFVAMASHELRTPIARVKGYAEMLLSAQADGALEPDMLERGLQRIDHASTRLAGLVRDLLDVSRMTTSGTLPLRPRALNVADLLRDLVSRCQEQLAPGNHVHLQVIGTPPVVAGDPERLEQVFQNLLDNAVKYSPEGAELHVRVEDKARGVVVEVQDHGIGLPSGAAEGIFEAFGRASNAQERQIQGMGLGLYICRNIVEQHRGRIWAKSDGEGRGTVITVWLPEAGPTLVSASTMELKPAA